LPGVLRGLADEVTVHFPWGSLLRGIVGADAAVIAPLAMLLRPSGELRIIVSATAHDGFTDIVPAHMRALASGYADCGLALVEARDALRADLARAHSRWAKRLGAPTARPATLARYRRLA
jgi:16S rRNA (adenine(1408)-N(1))-methyltransferase